MLEFLTLVESGTSIAEFVYNNIHQMSIRMAPFEALYGRPYCSLVFWAGKEDVLC